MTDEDRDAKRLRDLEERLQKARGSGAPSDQQVPPSKLSIAFRLSTELMAAVIMGGGIGWGLDRLFGTAPVLLIVMFLFGIAAGVVNAARATREMDANAGAGPKA